MLKRFVNILIIFSFGVTSIQPLALSQSMPVKLPVPGAMVSLSPVFEPALIKGLTVHKDNPLLFDFIVDTGNDTSLSNSTAITVKEGILKKEADRLIKYFFACLTIPEKDLWVNLSPYEKNRMVPQALGQTALGRDLLAEDYVLKQLTASLIYPEKNLGKEFWDRIYTKARQMYGTTQIPVNTFNKVWIVADKASIYEHGQTAFVVGGHMKVMLEEDYLALSRHYERVHDTTGVSGTLRSFANAQDGKSHIIASQIIREIVLPELEKEVNTGRNFATLRQIFSSLILATWYKKNLKEALLNQVYADQSKINGIKMSQGGDIVNFRQDLSPQQIYQQYLKAYKKGVFNYIKEDAQADGQTIPRKYFSGGYGSTLEKDGAMTVTHDPLIGEEVSAPKGEIFDFATVADINKPPQTRPDVVRNSTQVQVINDNNHPVIEKRFLTLTAANKIYKVTFKLTAATSGEPKVHVSLNGASRLTKLIFSAHEMQNAQPWEIIQASGVMMPDELVGIFNQNVKDFEPKSNKGLAENNFEYLIYLMLNDSRLLAPMRERTVVILNKFVPFLEAGQKTRLINFLQDLMLNKKEHKISIQKEIIKLLESLGSFDVLLQILIKIHPDLNNIKEYILQIFKAHIDEIKRQKFISNRLRSYLLENKIRDRYGARSTGNILLGLLKSDPALIANVGRASDGNGAWVEIYKAKSDVSKRMARRMADILKEKNKKGLYTLFILPTGNTAIPIHHAFAEIVERENVDCSKLMTGNMDEYGNSRKYHDFMWEHLFRRIESHGFIDNDEHVLFFNGYASDPKAELDRYVSTLEKMKTKAGGVIDLEVGGMGVKGHVAFNESPKMVNQGVDFEALLRELPFDWWEKNEFELVSTDNIVDQMDKILKLRQKGRENLVDYLFQEISKNYPGISIDKNKIITLVERLKQQAVIFRVRGLQETTVSKETIAELAGRYSHLIEVVDADEIKKAKARKVELSISTILANAGDFIDELDNMSTWAYTIGLGTVLSPKEIMIAATGAKKAWAIQASIKDENPEIPASALSEYPKARFIIDEEASLLLNTTYYVQQQINDAAMMEKGSLNLLETVRIYPSEKLIFTIPGLASNFSIGLDNNGRGLRVFEGWKELSEQNWKKNKVFEKYLLITINNGVKVDVMNVSKAPISYNKTDFAMNAGINPALYSWKQGGIDLNTSDMGMTVTKDASGWVKVDFDPALILRIRTQGLQSAVPEIINVTPMTDSDIRPLLGLAPRREEEKLAAV